MIFFFFDTEVWRDIIGFEGLYMVSNLGRIKSLDRVVLKSDGRYCTFHGRIMKQYPTTTCRYLTVRLSKNCKLPHFLVHILVAKAFYGDYDKGLEINHIDGNVLNNRIDNLEIVTHQENIDHSVATGLKHDYGERHVFAKLTNKQAQWVREQAALGVKQKDIAAQLGVSKQLINVVVLNKRYVK